MKRETPVEILVVGGGIGGLAVSLALARRGRSVQVLEAAPEFGEIGAGIQLAPNATHMLDRLEVLPAVIDCSVLPRSLVFMDAVKGEPLTSVDLGADFLGHYGTPYVVLHRSDLHSILLDACRREERIALAVDKLVVRVEDRGDGALAECADGSSYSCEALIGADGLRSVVRRLMSDDEPVASGYVAYRGTISTADVGPPRAPGQHGLLVGAGAAPGAVQGAARRALQPGRGVPQPRGRPESEEFGSPPSSTSASAAAARRPPRCRAAATRDAVADDRPRPDHDLVAEPHHAPGRRGAPDAPVSRARRLPGARGRAVPRRHGDGPRPVRRRVRGLRGHPRCPVRTVSRRPRGGSARWCTSTGSVSTCEPPARRARPGRLRAARLARTSPKWGRWTRARSAPEADPSVAPMRSAVRAASGATRSARSASRRPNGAETLIAATARPLRSRMATPTALTSASLSPKLIA